jgi:uncharacterized protein YjbJ (UPF0337 family)
MSAPCVDLPLQSVRLHDWTQHHSWPVWDICSRALLRSEIGNHEAPNCVFSIAATWRRVDAKGATLMDWDRVEGNWKQLTGKVKEKWGKLTDDDLTAINGKREQLEGKIQERYGYAKDQARREVDDWYNSQNW